MNINWINSLSKFNKYYIVYPLKSGSGGTFGCEILFEGAGEKCLTKTPMQLGYEDWFVQEFDLDFYISVTKNLDGKIYKWNKYDWLWEKIK